MDQTTTTQPVAPLKPSAPLSIKLFATFLLLTGVSIGFNVFSSIFALFLSVTAGMLGLVISIASFYFIEKTALQLIRLDQKGIRNFYIAVGIIALNFNTYIKLSLLVGAVDGTALLSSLLASAIIFLVPAVLFFLITRNKLPEPSINPKRDNKILIAIIIVLVVGGNLYSAYEHRNDEQVQDKINNQILQSITETARKQMQEPIKRPVVKP